jgi:hypothetical protein
MSAGFDDLPGRLDAPFDRGFDHMPDNARLRRTRREKQNYRHTKKQLSH